MKGWRPRVYSADWKFRGARHSAREGWKFLGSLDAECHAGTLGLARGRGRGKEGAVGGEEGMTDGGKGRKGEAPQGRHA
ncbi:MAG TPA: hypothetical protein VLL52_02275 [Anaerolineae bacterium]|nr:hypothetical protein [Anaerolineae bacterium]